MTRVRGDVNGYRSLRDGRGKESTPHSEPPVVKRRDSAGVIVSQEMLDDGRFQYVGIKRESIYHTVGCAKIYNPTRDDLVGFYSQKEVSNSGRTPCEHCVKGIRF